MPSKNQALHMIKQFIAPEHYVRSTWYSDIYRADLVIMRDTGLWDIHYIRIPFRKEKEIAAMKRFGITEEQLPAFYNDVLTCLKTEMDISRHIQEKTKNNDSLATLSKSCIHIQYAIGGSSNNGKVREIIFVTKPCQTMQDAGMISEDSSILLSDLLKVSVRIYQTMNKLNDIGVHLGAIDFDDIVLTIPKHENEQPFIVVNNLFYATMPDKPYLKTKPLFMPQNAWAGLSRNGNIPTLESDIFSLSSFIWTISDGRNWDNEPNFEARPAYLPDPLVQPVWDGFKMLEEYAPQLNRVLNRYLSHIRKGKINNFTIPSVIYTIPPATETEETEETEEPEENATSVTDQNMQDTQDAQAQDAIQPQPEETCTTEAGPCEAVESNVEESTASETCEASLLDENREDIRSEIADKDAAVQDDSTDESCEAGNTEDEGSPDSNTDENACEAPDLESLTTDSTDKAENTAEDTSSLTNNCSTDENGKLCDDNDDTNTDTDTDSGSENSVNSDDNSNEETSAEETDQAVDSIASDEDTDASLPEQSDEGSCASDTADNNCTGDENPGEQDMMTGVEPVAAVELELESESESEPVTETEPEPVEPETDVDINVEDKVEVEPEPIADIEIAAVEIEMETDAETESEPEPEKQDEESCKLPEEKQDEDFPVETTPDNHFIEKETELENIPANETSCENSSVPENDESSLPSSVSESFYNEIENNESLAEQEKPENEESKEKEETIKTEENIPSHSNPEPTEIIEASPLSSLPDMSETETITEDKRENTLNHQEEEREENIKRWNERFEKKEESPWLCSRCNTVCRSLFCPICHNSRVANARSYHTPAQGERYSVSANDLVAKLIQQKKEELTKKEKEQKMAEKKAAKSGKNPFAFVSDGPTKLTIPEIKTEEPEQKKKEEKKKEPSLNETDPFAFINDEVFFTFGEVSLN